MQCQVCGTQLPAEAKACPNCGTLTPIYYANSGASPNDPTMAALSGSSPYAMSAPPPPTQYGSNPYDVSLPSPYDVNSYTVPPPPPPRPPRKVSPVMIGILTVLIFLIVGAGVGFVLLRSNQGKAPIPLAATSPTVSNTGNANVIATTTATAFQDLYNTSTNRIPTYDDALSDNTKGMQWDQGQGCTFTGGGYHISETQSRYFQTCRAHRSNVSNGVYQVQMTINKGGYGGLIFRADVSFLNYYIFRVGQDGVYSFAIYKNNINTEVKHGPSPTFKQGPGQTNLITIIAQGANFTFYVNSQYVYSTSDSSFSSGKIALVAGSIGSPTEVVYNNAKLWTF